MSYNREYARDVVLLVKDFEKSFRDMMEVTRQVSPPINDQSKPTDEQFAAWYEMKTAENPNWALALPYVDGGPDLIKRYEKIRGLDDGRMASAGGDGLRATIPEWSGGSGPTP